MPSGYGPWQAEDHGRGRWLLVVLVGAVVAAALVVVPVVLALFHFLVDALTVAGAVAVAGGLVWVRVKWHRRMWMSQPQQAVPPFRQRQPVGQPQYQALPAPEVHNHLHLHGEDAARVFRDARMGD